MGYKAVFFDAGETLVHAEPSFHELFAEVLLQRGHRVEPEKVLALVPAVMERFAEAANAGELWSTSRERSMRFWYSVYAIFLEELDLPPSLGETLYETFSDPDSYALFSDVKPVLAELHARGYEMAVVSNFEAWLDTLLDRLGVNGYFPVRVISGVVGVEKPDPTIFRLALERTGVLAAETVYVGDSPGFDVAPASALGMFPVLVDRRDRHPDHDGARIRSLDELLRVVAG